jgi:hypothetical protein
MATATFRFNGELAAFLSPDKRKQDVDLACARAATIKNAVEAHGVPHTEVGRLLREGLPVTLSRTVRDGDVIEVFVLDVDMPSSAEQPESGKMRGSGVGSQESGLSEQP